ncbi:hypothetical protein OG496_00775 [Streptomyces sp. NBC_00988]|uniref:hypothetical protein n=1 Tax=Streptomyces sp. NBC_00988 TaxID=2903704 RepID=UPI003870034B|nr:hypothetical protein OG496_00775 [Streptomyces sp. NBC_00988]
MIRRDGHTGAEEEAAESFAGFLTGHVARVAGVGDGPTPSLARLWRSTPGVHLPGGVVIYGPQDILERNETYKVGEYQPDWILIGDDSGGVACSCGAAAVTGRPSTASISGRVTTTSTAPAWANGSRTTSRTGCRPDMAGVAAPVKARRPAGRGPPSPPDLMSRTAPAVYVPG